MKNDLNFNKVAKFINRLYKIVSDDKYKEIGWSDDGKGFRIYDKESFMKNVLPLVSKTREYSAFIRQLNLYGFIKVKSASHLYEEYFHNNFQKDREELLPYVKNDREKTINIYDAKPTLVAMDSRYQEALECLSRQNYILENRVNILKERVDKQECTINGLIEILSRMFQFSKPENNTPQLKSNQKNFENLKIAHKEDSVQECSTSDENKFTYGNSDNIHDIYNMARNNFEIEKYFNDRAKLKEDKPNKQDAEHHRALRKEVFGDSDETNYDFFKDDVF